MINANLTRWINASIDKYFIDNAGSYPVYIDYTEPDLRNTQTWAELRKIGPVIIPQSSNEFLIQIAINILCGNKRDFKDTHKIHKITGHFQSKINTIHVYRYGVGDDESFVGCLEIRDDIPRPIDTINWGVTDESLKIENVSIEAFYKMQYSQ